MNSTPNNTDYESRDISDKEIGRLRKDIADAIASGNVEQEAYARTDLCNLLVVRGDEKAFEELYPALNAIRRIQDYRHELMLCINFTDFLLEHGETKRALELSERALALSERGFAAHYILALFNHGKVWAKGLGEPREAMKFYLSAVKRIEEIPQSNAEQKLQLICRLHSYISEAAKTALSLKLYSEAESILKLVDPEITERMRKELDKIDSKKAALNTETLNLATFPPLESVLAAWRGKRHTAEVKPEAEQALKRMEQLSQILNLKEQLVRLRGLLPAEAENETRNGPGGLVQLAQHLTSGELDFSAASKLAKGLPNIDGDLPCLCLFALQDKGLSESGVAINLLRLCAAIASNKRLSASLHSVLAIFLKSAGSLDDALAAYLAAEALLTDNAEIGERAKLCSEASSILLELNRAQEAFDLATKANELAQEAGALNTVANSYGNIGVSLMQMKRYSEALAIFEKLKDMQQSLGDSKGLEITRFNISACKIALDQSSVPQFDLSSTDPFELFNLATKWVKQGNSDHAAQCLEKGLALAEASGKPSPRLNQMRVQYARSLYSAGRLNEAVEQMKIAAKAFEYSGDAKGLHEAYGWLASFYTKDRGSKLSEYYAGLALDIGRNIGDPETLAIDLAQLGQAKIVTNRYREAINYLEEARHLKTEPKTKASVEVTLADALIKGNRPKEAVEIYEKLQSNKEYSADTELQLHLLVGLAEAHQALYDNQAALRFLEDAHKIAAVNLEPVEGQVEVANRLGALYLAFGKLEDAAHVLEEGIEQAKQLRLKNRQLSLLLNLSNVLRETGDLAGSENILKEILKTARAEVIQEMELESLTNLGQITFSQEKYNQSLSYLQEAAALAHQINDPLAEGICLDQIGVIYSYQGKPERAVEHHKQAAKLHGQAGKLEHQIIDLVNLSQAYLVLKEDELANQTVQQAQRIRKEQEKLTSKSVAPDWGLSLTAGLVAARLGNWKQARISLKETINTLESLRGTVLSPMQKRQWAARKADAYALATEAAITAEDGPTAIEFNESNKTRFLQEILQRRAKRPQRVNEQEWLRYERAADNRAMLRARWRAGLSADDSDTLLLLRQAESEYFTALGVIQDATEGFAQGVAPTELDWRKLVSAIPTGYTAVSIGAFHTGLGIICAGTRENGEPWATAKMFDSFTITSLSRLIFGDVEVGFDAFHSGLVLDDFPLDSIGWSRGTMLVGLSGRSRDSHQRRFSFNVRDPMALSKNVIAYTCKKMGELIWPLIIEALPEGSKNLIIVPSRGLNVLPLHAARLSDGTFVDERFNVAYAPSLNILAQENRPAFFSNTRQIGQVVNPTKDLLFADVEARAVAQNFDVSKVTSLKGSEGEVDTKKILDLLEKVDVFHYSGHAFYDREEPFSSGLLLSENKSKPVTLTLKNILERLASIQSKLVVLSACETGKVEPTDILEDFLGLPGGFLAAGANTVLASLWPTDDLATCLLFEKFYELWQPPTTISEALTAAQQWLRRGLTVGDVKKKLDVWLEKWPDLSEQIEELQWFWTAKTDDNAQPFNDEIFWAAFYLTGIPI
jgi:CHAT domain-containing protein/tetratricopeptide (TPR) repeat protein